MRFQKILGLNGGCFFSETYSGKETRIGIWMDPENKPNKQRTRIGGGYMAAVVVAVVVYGYGSVVVYGYGSVVVYGHGLVVVYGYGFGAVVVDGRAMMMVRRRRDNL